MNKCFSKGRTLVIIHFNMCVCSNICYFAIQRYGTTKNQYNQIYNVRHGKAIKTKHVSMQCNQCQNKAKSSSLQKPQTYERNELKQDTHTNVPRNEWASILCKRLWMDERENGRGHMCISASHRDMPFRRHGWVHPHQERMHLIGWLLCCCMLHRIRVNPSCRSVKRRTHTHTQMSILNTDGLMHMDGVYDVMRPTIHMNYDANKCQ